MQRSALYISHRSLGDSVIHARMICEKHRGCLSEAEVIAPATNLHVFGLFGISGIPLDSPRDGALSSGRIARITTLAQQIRRLHGGRRVVLLFGDLFDRILALMLIGVDVLLPDTNLSSISSVHKIRWRPVKRVIKRDRTSTYYAELARYLGLGPTCGAKMEIEAEVGAGPRRQVLIAPYASAEVKNMIPQVIAELVLRLRSEAIEVALLVDPAFAGPETRRLPESLGIPVVERTLLELSGELQRYSCVIASDSFVMHLAGALGIHCIVFTAGNKPRYWLHEHAESVGRANGCVYYPCSNFPVHECGFVCKAYADDELDTIVRRVVEIADARGARRPNYLMASGQCYQST